MGQLGLALVRSRVAGSGIEFRSGVRVELGRWQRSGRGLGLEVDGGAREEGGSGAALGTTRSQEAVGVFGLGAGAHSWLRSEGDVGSMAAGDAARGRRRPRGRAGAAATASSATVGADLDRLWSGAVEAVEANRRAAVRVVGTALRAWPVRETARGGAGSGAPSLEGVPGVRGVGGASSGAGGAGSGRGAR